MIGIGRPLDRYAEPRSRMNVTGECVGLLPLGLSPPRGARPAPNTRTDGRTALIASYVCARRRSNAGAAASDPSALNCGCQKRLLFGSLPTTKSVTLGTVWTIACAYWANCARSTSVSGVLLD